ncbi:hypothetical protein [Shinella sumterensis]|uniref:Uncharacterized protein n=1 Tax=Shinella sumterensis TaxID=1967501 RepID=A0AA50CKJ0_9HYPH|nr:hypothetical protein [Shinella sumterensis]WLR96174.1 hypothetical protein Q9313_10545 [Shinella sumterensis]
MVSKARAIVDDGFLVGLVFALFLAGKIVRYLVWVGVVPIFLFWAKSDYAKPAGMLMRFLLPTVGYSPFAFCFFMHIPAFSPASSRRTIQTSSFTPSPLRCWR